MAYDKHLDHLDSSQLLRELRLRELAAYLGQDITEDYPLREAETSAIVKALKRKQKVIYGVDDRQDLFEVSDPKLIKDADSVVSIWNAVSIVNDLDGTSTLFTQDFEVAKNLCNGEPFGKQPTGSICSGFLVGPCIVATAGHCVDDANIGRLSFVFGFQMIDATNAQTTVSNTEIYQGSRVLRRFLDNGGADWALVTINGLATNHTIASFRKAGVVADKQKVHVIGHPSGLPIKVAGGAEVRDNEPAQYFIANLDTYTGNSGSPVFNSETHEVEGILSYGENDFVAANGCNVSLVCPNTGCAGEIVTRATAVSKHIRNKGGLTVVGEFNFGNVKNGLEYYDAVTVTNTGTEVLNINVTSSDNLFTAVPRQLTLGPCQTANLSVSWLIIGTGQKLANMILTSNDSQSPFAVQFRAKSVGPDEEL